VREAGRMSHANAPVPEDLPVLVVRRDLAQDEAGRMYADGEPIAPGRYRVVLPDVEDGPAQDAVLVVGDPADLDAEDRAPGTNSRGSRRGSSARRKSRTGPCARRQHGCAPCGSPASSTSCFIS
jgi:hypothetical protein